MTVQALIDEYKAKTAPNSVDPVLTGDMVQAVYDEDKTLSFRVITTDRIPSINGISTDPANPTYATGLQIDSEEGGFELVNTGPWANTGAVRNVTGFDIDVIGTFSFYPDNSGGTSRIDMWSETSMDGITILENAGSARSIEVANSGESTSTKSSRFTDWPNGGMIRFVFTDTGGGQCALVKPVVTTTQGAIDGASFSFQENVVKRVVP